MTSRLIAGVCFVVFAAPPTWAQSPSVDESFWTRSRLTGDWGGARSDLDSNGVTIDLQYTSTYQGLVASSWDRDSGYGGKFNGFINLDSGKLGLWEGGGLRTHLEYRHGDALANLGGTLFATNTAQLWPVNEPEELVATSLYFAQKVGERSSILAGKFNPIDFYAADPFFGGWGIYRFMNLIFVAPPSGLIPPVFMGVVANIGTERSSWTVMVYDPNDRTSDYFPGDLFSDGVNIMVTAAFRGAIAGRKTSYSVTAGYSTADSVDYSTMPPGMQTSNKSGAYNVAFQFTHNFQEITQQTDASWGLYFKVATADGNPNYVQASILGGIGGRALFFGRPQDSFGLGAFYYDLSDELQDSLDPLAEFGDESGVEAYYSWSLAPWLYVSGDIQFIDPARRGADSSVIAGVRANIRF